MCLCVLVHIKQNEGSIQQNSLHEREIKKRRGGEREREECVVSHVEERRERERGRERERERERENRHLHLERERDVSRHIFFCEPSEIYVMSH